MLESRNDTLVGLRATGAGGALYAGILAEVTVVGGRFERCASETSVGGALYAENVARLRVVDAAFRANTAAIAAGLMPNQLAEFERTCCAIPDALRRNPGRLCTLRNHFLSRASKMANRFMPLAEATKGLDPVWRTSTEESEQAAAVYECLSHHGLINWGVIDDHPAMVAPGRAPPFPQWCACRNPAPRSPTPRRRRPSPSPRRRRPAAAGGRCASSSSARARPGWRRRVLQLLGHSVCVIEARERIGGRVLTMSVAGGGSTWGDGRLE